MAVLTPPGQHALHHADAAGRLALLDGHSLGFGGPPEQTSQAIRDGHPVAARGGQGRSSCRRGSQLGWLRLAYAHMAAFLRHAQGLARLHARCPALCRQLAEPGAQIAAQADGHHGQLDDAGARYQHGSNGQRHQHSHETAQLAQVDDQRAVGIAADASAAPPVLIRLLDIGFDAVGSAGLGIAEAVDVLEDNQGRQECQQPASQTQGTDDRRLIAKVPRDQPQARREHGSRHSQCAPAEQLTDEPMQPADEALLRRKRAEDKDDGAKHQADADEIQLAIQVQPIVGGDLRRAAGLMTRDIKAGGVRPGVSLAGLAAIAIAPFASGLGTVARLFVMLGLLTVIASDASANCADAATQATRHANDARRLCL